MEKKQFLSIAREFFREKGCQIIKNSRFIYQEPDFDVKFEMTHSNFGEYYYLNYFIYLHGANIFYSKSASCTSGRVKVMETYEMFYLEIDPNVFARRLEKAFDAVLKPIFEKGFPYIVYMWKKNICHFYGDAERYLKSIDK